MVSPAILFKTTSQRERGDPLRDRLPQFRGAQAIHLFIAGGAFQGPNDVIVDNIFATNRNPATGQPYAVNDMVKVMDHPFRISGIVEHGKGGRKLLPIDTMGDLMGSSGRASMFYIKSDDAANDETVMQEIHDQRAGFGNNSLMTVDSWLSQMTPDKVPGFNIALEVVTGIAVIIGFLVIFQSMYTAVLERTREIGILKSMGASKLTIVAVVLRECGVLAVAGVIVGIAGVFGVRSLLGAHFFHGGVRDHRIVDLAGCSDRIPRCDRWGALSVLDGRPEGPDRSARIRIVRS